MSVQWEGHVREREINLERVNPVEASQRIKWNKSRLPKKISARFPKKVSHENRVSDPEAFLGVSEKQQSIWNGSGPMHPELFPITLEKGAVDQKGTGPVYLAEGVVTEAGGEKKKKNMDRGQVGLA